MSSLAETIKVRDVVVITTRMKKGEEERIGQVTAVGPEGFSYEGYYGALNTRGLLQTGAGGCEFAKVGAREFGVQKVEVVGRDRFPMDGHWTPKPGDRGYDPM